jgi:hypothetical protein
VINLDAQTFTYDCAAQPGELKESGVMLTEGCNWPNTNPDLEVDIVVDPNHTRSTPVQDETFDLATASPSDVQVVAGVSNPADMSKDSIYSSWRYPDPNVAGQDMIVARQTTGTVVVHSYDPVTGKIDASLTGVTMPLTNSLPSEYPNAPALIHIPSAEMTR